MKRLPVAVIGVGHLGKEHARILASLPGAELVAVVDPNLMQAEQVASRCGTTASTDHHDCLDRVAAVVVAAPTCYHHSVARDCLERGIHVLVEKPMASNTAQARELVELANHHGAILQVGHIERFNPAFEELQSRTLRPRYLIAERYSGFSGRSTDVGVVLDLMIHDLDLILALANAPVERVEAFGAALLGGNEDLAQARVTFTNGCVADVCASRVQPEASRRMRIWGAEGYAGVDFAKRTLTLMQPSEPLRQGRLDSRRLDMNTLTSLRTELFTRYVQTQQIDCSPRHSADQLTRELEEFLSCARTGTQPRADGQAGLAALELAGHILDCIRSHTWETGSVGPQQVPPARGYLFPPGAQEAA